MILRAPAAVAAFGGGDEVRDREPDPLGPVGSGHHVLVGGHTRGLAAFPVAGEGEHVGDAVGSHAALAASFGVDPSAVLEDRHANEVAPGPRVEVDDVDVGGLVAQLDPHVVVGTGLGFGQPVGALVADLAGAGVGWVGGPVGDRGRRVSGGTGVELPVVDVGARVGGGPARAVAGGLVDDVVGDARRRVRWDGVVGERVALVGQRVEQRWAPVGGRAAGRAAGWPCPGSAARWCPRWRRSPHRSSTRR